MIYWFDMDSIPSITHIYKISRKTVWQVTDPYNILVTVTDGSCIFYINNREYTVNAGESFFIPHDVNYTRKPCDNKMCTFYYMHFSMETQMYECNYSEANEQLNKVRNINSTASNNEFYHNSKNCIFIANKTKYADFEKVIDLLEKIRTELLKNHFESRIRASLYLGEILTYTTREARRIIADKNDVNMSGAVNPKLKKALEYIRLNYANKITLDDICNHANVSAQHLIRCFKNDLNKTPIEYINEYRLNRAKEYFLSFPALSVKEVANELGFDDSHYFSRLFAKMNNGETPTQFRYRVTHFKNSEE